MRSRANLTYGDLPVPWPIMWSAEEEYFVDTCPWFKLPAICQNQAQGEGVPKFGRPHAVRQRQMIASGLCDICAEPLQNSTKISLSIARPVDHNPQILWQIEPLLHAECARQSLKHCPSLQRQLAAGTFRAKQVFSYRAKALFANPEDLQSFVPNYSGVRPIGLGAIDLLLWKDITNNFLMTTISI